MLNYMYDVSKEVSRLRCPRGGVSMRSSKKKMFKMIKPRTEKFKKTFSYFGPKKWNALPEDIQYATSKLESKSKVTDYINRRSIRLSGVAAMLCHRD